MTGLLGRFGAVTLAVVVVIFGETTVAQQNETCDCSGAKDGCAYLNLKCKNGGTFTGHCGEALCPVQQSNPNHIPAEPFAGAGWRAIRPFGDATPQVGCGSETETFECANGLYVDKFGAVAESQFGLTVPESGWVDWSEVCTCPSTHIGSECAQVKSPELNNRDNCPDGQVFDGTPLNPLRAETEMECFIKYPFFITILLKTFVEFKHHRVPITFHRGSDGEIDRVTIDINARFVPAASANEVCTDMVELSCAYTDCQTLSEDGKTVVECATTSCADIVPCERCKSERNCDIFNGCSYYGLKYMQGLFNGGSSAVGLPRFTILSSDARTGELGVAYDALNGAFHADLDCRVGSCFPKADLPEGSRCPATNDPSVLCTESCYAEELCGLQGRVVQNATDALSSTDVVLVSSAWFAVVFSAVCAGLIVVWKRSKARMQWMNNNTVSVLPSSARGSGSSSSPSPPSAKLSLLRKEVDTASGNNLGDGHGESIDNEAQVPVAAAATAGAALLGKGTGTGGADGVDTLSTGTVEWYMDTDDMDPVAFASVFRRQSLPLERRIGISCLDVSYSIANASGSVVRRSPFVAKREILRSVSIAVEPGQLTALIGPSGSGKSTLLDVLVGRPKKGKVSGSVVPIFPTVEGHVRVAKHLRRSVAYIRQDDCLLPTETVFEAVWFAGRMRLGAHVSDKELKLRVLTTLRSLHIDHIAKSRIGNTQTGGISGGERRRVATALELVSNPSVLCCDEITSGLDSFSTKVMIKVLRHAAHRRRATVLCAIHQPPSQIFSAFDNVVLMTKLGGVAYSGPTGMLVPYLHTLVEFNATFATTLPSLDQHSSNNSRTDDNDDGIDISVVSSGIHPTAAATTAAATAAAGSEVAFHTSNKTVSRTGEAAGPVPDTRAANPSELALEFVSTISLEATERVHRYWKTSDQHAAIAARVAQVARANAGGTSGSKNGEPVVVSAAAVERLPSQYRFLLLCERCIRTILRQPSLMFMQFAVTLGVAALMSVTAGNLERDLQGAQTMTSLSLFYILFFAMMSMSSVGTIATDIAVFVREKEAKLYSAHQYVLSKMLCDVLPLRVLPPTAFACVTYWSMGLYPDLANFSQYVLALILVNVTTTALCFFVTSVCLSVGLSNLVSAALIVWCFVFSGYVILTPVGLTLRWSSYFFCAWEIIVGNEFKQGKYLFNPQGVGLEFGVERDATDIIKQLEVQPSRAGLDFVLLFSWATVLVVATFLTLQLRRFPS